MISLIYGVDTIFIQIMQCFKLLFRFSCTWKLCFYYVYALSGFRFMVSSATRVTSWLVIGYYYYYVGYVSELRCINLWEISTNWHGSIYIPVVANTFFKNLRTANANSSTTKMRAWWHVVTKHDATQAEIICYLFCKSFISFPIMYLSSCLLQNYVQARRITINSTTFDILELGDLHGNSFHWRLVRSYSYNLSLSLVLADS